MPGTRPGMTMLGNPRDGMDAFRIPQGTSAGIGSGGTRMMRI